MKLLVIDDNAALMWRLRTYLEKQFEVDIARTGMEGRHLAEAKHYDTIILDLNLPDIDGEKVCAQLRASGITSLILILTAKDSVTSKVRLLNVGADDYLTKPFEPTELLARINALQRRYQTVSPTPKLRSGNLVLDPQHRTVERESISISLRRKEFDILEYLLHNQGKIITIHMILDHVWDDSDKTMLGNTVRVHIKNLRDKIDRPFDAPLIKTMHGVGYIIEHS